MRAATIGLLMLAVLADVAGAQTRAPVWPQRPPENQKAPPGTFWAETMAFTIARHGLTGECFVDGRAVRAFDIYAVGEFDAGASERFQSFLRANPPVAGCTTVYFHSSGGSLAEGLKIGAIIRQRKLDTSIGRHFARAADLVAARDDAICFSSCSFAFLGGVRRSKGLGHYGVHRFYRGPPADENRDAALPPGAERWPKWVRDAYFMERSQVTNAMLLNYLRFMAVSPELLEEMARAKGVVDVHRRREPDQNFLDAATMARLGITTPLAAGEWAIVNDRGAAAVRATIRDRDRQNALLLTCERERGGAAPRMMLSLFLQTAEPDAFVSRRPRLEIWRRDIGGPVKDGFRPLVRNDVALASVVRAERSPQHALLGGGTGVVMHVPLAALPFDVGRQSEIFFGYTPDVAPRLQRPERPRQLSVHLDMTGGTRKIAELADTCR